MPCLNVREAIRALKCKTTKLKTLFLCHFVPTALKQMHMEAVFSLSLLSCRSINITSKSVAAAWGGRFMLNQNDLSARQEDCVHPRDLSSQDLLLILLLCNGKDSVLTSDRAEHLLSPEMQKRKKLQHQQGILFCVKHTAGSWLLEHKMFEHD